MAKTSSTRTMNAASHNKTTSSPDIDALSIRMTSTAKELSDHRAIYDHIVNSILPVLHADASCPPLHVITYAIRNILSPSVLYSLMIELLTLLAHVDCVRNKFLARLNAIITWDDHFKLAKYREADIVVLDNKERRIVEQAQLTLGESARRSYRSIVLKYSQLAIYDTWISHRWKETEQTLSIYYPPLEEETPVYLFHHGLSAAEKQELNASYNSCLKLVKKWVQESAGWRQRPTADELRKVYPPPVREKELVALTHQYLYQLESTVEKISEILNSTS